MKIRDTFTAIGKAVPWIISPIGAHVGTAVTRALDYEELLTKIAAVTGESADDVRHRIKVTADGSLASLVDTAAIAYVDAIMGRTA